MDNGLDDTRTVNRGLLTPGEREVLRGEREVEDKQGYRYNIRNRFRDRMDELEEDLEILETHGEGDLVDEFFHRFGRVERLEAEVERLRQQLDDQSSSG